MFTKKYKYYKHGDTRKREDGFEFVVKHKAGLCEILNSDIFDVLSIEDVKNQIFDWVERVSIISEGCRVCDEDAQEIWERQNEKA